MSRAFIQLPTEGTGKKLSAEQRDEAGETVIVQTVEALPCIAIVSASVTRPSDTTAYAAGDALTNSTSAPVVTTVASIARYNGGYGRIRHAWLLDSANQTTKADIEAWLFAGTAGPTPDNDNALFTPTDAELANLVGIIEFKGTTKSYVGDATSGAGGNVIYPGTIAGTTVADLNLPFKCATTVKDLYCLFVVRNAYTPVSAEVFTLILDVEQG